MSVHSEVTDELFDRAAAYAFDGMADADRTAYEAHLQECGVCAAEVDALRAVMAELALSAPGVTPPADLRARVLARATRGPAALIRRAASDWQPSGLPGVSFRRLLRDAANDRQTVLVRLLPGAVYPVHTHGGTEECFVLGGDVRDGELRMTEGDYSRYEGGTRHGPLSTDDGCVLLISSSLSDVIHP